MRVTTYAYPWDVARLGAERVLDELAESGFSAIDLAATYHPIDALSPRDGVRLFTSRRGAVHFPARPERYARIVPSFDPDPAVRAAWPAVERAASARGIGVNSWTVLLFQPWIADAHPDCARVLPDGDPVGTVLCQSSPDVQEYFSILCEDLVDQFGIEMLRLEMAEAPTWDYGWLRPRVLVDVPALARQLLAVCFCASCRRAGREVGIDPEAVRARVQAAVAAELDADRPQGPADAERAADLVADTELRAYVLLQERAAIELVRGTVERIDPRRRPRVSTIVNTPHELLLGEDQRTVIAEQLAVVDQTLVFPWEPERASLVAELAAQAQPAVGLTTFVVPVNLGVLTGAGGADDGGDRVRQGLRAAKAYGLEEVNVYNYGLLRRSDVSSILTAIREELG
jgi:hypothetical protein